MNAIGQNRECSLTDLDWSVVEIARTDGARSLNPDGTFARFLRDFFGLRFPRFATSEPRRSPLSVRALYWDFPARDVRRSRAGTRRRRLSDPDTRRLPRLHANMLEGAI